MDQRVTSRFSALSDKLKQSYDDVSMMRDDITHIHGVIDDFSKAAMSSSGECEEFHQKLFQNSL